MTKNEMELAKARAQFKAAQQGALAAFSKVQFATMNAHINQWNTHHSKMLEDVVNEFSNEVKELIRAEHAVVVALAAGNDLQGPSPSDLITPHDDHGKSNGTFRREEIEIQG